MYSELFYEGQMFKNYRDMCRKLNIPIKTGEAKTIQLADINRYASVKKEDDGNKFYVLEVFDEPLEKEENMRNSQYKLVDTYPEKTKRIVNLLGNDINSLYCNSLITLLWECERCSRIFRDSIANVTKSKKIRCKGCSMSKYARKIKTILDQEYINYICEYKFHELVGIGGMPLKFDFAIFSDDNKLLGLIEYDGEFHDINEITMVHDELKNNYCKENSISLLRIHHTENNGIFKLIHFLKEIECSLYFGCIDIIESQSIQYEQDVAELAIINTKIQKLMAEKKKLKERLKSGYK